ncbi:MAG: glycosyl hydrolase 115 family protein [Bacteroidales bacterium]|nr:glycosyl hydrolase 115 family protein [Bacteroidales bacterium]
MKERKILVNTRTFMALRKYFIYFILLNLFFIFKLNGNESVIKVTTKNDSNYFSIVSQGKATNLLISENDYPGVLRIAGIFQSDIERVTGILPEIKNKKSPDTKEVIIIGTLGKSEIIQNLIENKKLKIVDIKGKWESYLIEVVEKPLPGIDRALVIAGSDKRGTIYGMFDLSYKMGVSPWYYWADVPVKKKDDVFIIPCRYINGEPKVKYRGIFLNDEAPALSGWVHENFGNYNHEFYVKVFELILRMKGNFLWPAMWNNAFADDDSLNMILADEYGIVMSTSHHEPMMRADKEWNRYGKGKWEYSTNSENLYNFWVDGAKRNKNYESIYTLGMRGQEDKPMSEGENIELLERIVRDQREILTNVFTDRDITEIPQVWCLYKEVQAYYEKGMRVPDDVTLLLCDDNWGNIRRLPNPEDTIHPGGFGIYYHYDFVGGPRNYKWLNTNPVPRIWEQMNLAYQHCATRIWIVNVGDLKPMEFPIEFFLDYAWNPENIQAEDIQLYTENWVSKQFGNEYVCEIAEILAKYAKYNSRRKPEMLSPETYSLIDYREFETVVNDYNSLAKKAEDIYNKLPAEYKDAYFQLILFPTKACANLNELYYLTGLNRLYASQGRALTNEMAKKVQELFNRDAELTDYYNKTMANGKWNHMMDQTHIGYTSWQQPDKNIMPEVKTINLSKNASMGIAVEGSSYWWPKENRDAVLPVFDPFHNQSYYIDVFNRGLKPFQYSVITDAEWLNIDNIKGDIEAEKRIWVNIDWDKAPSGNAEGKIVISGPDKSEVEVLARIINPGPKENIKGYIESNGYISIEAVNFQNKVEKAPVNWQIIPDLGRTNSAITIFPVTAKAQPIDSSSTHLSYNIHLFNSGEVKVTTYLSPTLNIYNDEGMKYGISFDDEKPVILKIQQGDTIADWKYPLWWNTAVSENIRKVTSTHQIDKPGNHELKFWAINPGIVIQKIVIETTGMKPNYLGPPESVYFSKKMAGDR